MQHHTPFLTSNVMVPHGGKSCKFKTECFIP